MNLAPLRPLEIFSDPEKRSSKQSYGTTFLRHYFAELLENFVLKKCSKDYFHLAQVPEDASVCISWVLGSNE